MAEEEYLIQELRKIEARKKEREKRTQDLQKLITAADTTTEQRRAERKAPKKKLPQKKETEKPVNTFCLSSCSLLWDCLAIFPARVCLPAVAAEGLANPRYKYSFLVVMFLEPAMSWDMGELQFWSYCG